MKAVVIGAGVAGLQAAEKLAHEYECWIFDKQDKPGGVWTRNYDGFALQVPAELYEFVGFPSRFARGSYPSGPEVESYILEFVEHRRLRERCTMRLGEEVLAIDREEGTWAIRTEKGTHYFDVCVIATGMYSTPFIPANLKSDHTIHSSQFCDAEDARGKDVIVVGAGKSALDCAVAAADHGAKRVRVISRASHWPVPRLIAGLIPFKWGTYSRLGHFLLPAHWDIGDSEKWWHAKLSPLKKAVWKTLEALFKFQFSLVHAPKYPLCEDLFNGGQILNGEFYAALHSGRIQWEIGDLDPQTMETADMVICATGFAKTYAAFDADTQKTLSCEADGLWLYRNITHPDVPNVFFIGSEVSTFNNILTHHLQARWMAEKLRTGLPSRDSMLRTIASERAWKRAWMPGTASRASLVQLHMTKYHDTLTADMHEPLPNLRWYEWVLPVSSHSYK